MEKLLEKVEKALEDSKNEKPMLIVTEKDKDPDIVYYVSHDKKGLKFHQDLSGAFPDKIGWESVVKIEVMTSRHAVDIIKSLLRLGDKLIVDVTEAQKAILAEIK